MHTKSHLVIIPIVGSILFAFLNVATAFDGATNDYSKGHFTITNEDGSITRREFVPLTTNIMEGFIFIATNMESAHAQWTAIQTNVSMVDKRWTAPVTNFPIQLTNAVFLKEVCEVAEPAAIYFNDLREHGRLPGIPKDSHGDFFLNESGLSIYWVSQKISYPCTLTFDAVMKGDPLTNHYSVIRPTKDSRWHLQRAWQTDPEGNVLTEWPIKH